MPGHPSRASSPGMAGRETAQVGTMKWISTGRLSRMTRMHRPPIRNLDCIVRARGRNRSSAQCPPYLIEALFSTTVVPRQGIGAGNGSLRIIKFRKGLPVVLFAALADQLSTVGTASERSFRKHDIRRDKGRQTPDRTRIEIGMVLLRNAGHSRPSTPSAES